ncbi:sigma-70 family RNA polymerase sigma factor [Aquimarina hainanensis]|uniref:Sigma-70 family RNA polymerase sigma factor n=1 Tax=Aquimarina hainanensis TaxID=1578017 RepID=A0ABW5N521_9FLAO
MSTTQIWNTYKDEISSFIRRKVNDTHVAEDLIQETFIKVHLKIGKVKDKTKIRAWIYAIARNGIYDFFKKQALPVPIDTVQFAEEVTIHEHTEKDCLPGIIRTLPERYKKVVYLSDIKGMKAKEIATILNSPLSTIKSKIQRGRELVKKGFIDCCDYQVNKEGKLIGERKHKNECKVCME